MQTLEEFRDYYKNALDTPMVERYKDFRGIREIELCVAELPNTLICYVDGGFSKTKFVSSSGIYVPGCFRLEGEVYPYSVAYSIHDGELTKSRNVTGEVFASMRAILLAAELNLLETNSKPIKEVGIIYDYMGIEKWATGEWGRNNDLTKGYYRFIQDAKQFFTLHFRHVKGHSGVDGNERADALATKGLELAD